MLKTQVIEDQSEPFYDFTEKFNLIIDENQFNNAELVLEVYDMSGIKQLFGETKIELKDIFSNPNDKFVFEALLNNESKESKI